MSSSSLPGRSWGLNRGEESFLGAPVGMITLAGCTASCLFCYLADGDARPVALDPEEFSAIGRDLARRGATCLYLVNPEVPCPDHLAAALAALHRLEPAFPVVVKLGGHEPLDLAMALRPWVDGVSLDVKVFGVADAIALVGCADYANRVRSLIDYWRAELGPWVGDEGAIRGVWLRHLVLPGRAHLWGEGLRTLDPTGRLPVWVTMHYRPFGRARGHPVLGRRLEADERGAAAEVVRHLRIEGRTVWVA